MENIECKKTVLLYSVNDTKKSDVISAVSKFGDVTVPVMLTRT